MDERKCKDADEVRYKTPDAVEDHEIDEQVACRWRLIYGVLVGNLYKDILHSEIYKLLDRKFQSEA